MKFIRKIPKWIYAVVVSLSLAATPIISLFFDDGSADAQLAIAPLEVHFIDIGQGDCTLIVCDGSAMLIDAGENNKGTVVQSYIEKQGIERLDYVIGTHPDSDHIGGLDVAIYKFDCGTIIMPEFGKDTKTYDDVIQTMKNKNYKNTLPEVGKEYKLGDATFTIVAPNGTYGNDANDYSVGIILTHGENKFVLLGDAEEKAETDILKNGIDLSANVYKASHHGSRTSSMQELLDAIDMEYVVISCGTGNSYRHPHKETLDRLKKMKVKVFRTDEQGTIIATSDGKNIKWNCKPSKTWAPGEESVPSS